MGIVNTTIVDRLAVLLASVGYTFHDAPDDIPFGDKQDRHWFCWTDGKCDVETGPDCGSQIEAVASAMEHWFEHARIEVIEHAPTWVPGIYDEIASGEGWGIFNEGEIQRDDEADVFESDEAALEHVERLADNGSLLHQAAIASHAKAKRR